MADISTNIGKVRLLCVDTQEAVFSDDEIQAFIDITSIDGEPDIRKAAALALETIASSEVLVQKKISTLDLSTDGPSLAKSLRESALKLREETENEVAFGVIEQGHNIWTTYEIIRNEIIRTYS